LENHHPANSPEALAAAASISNKTKTKVYLLIVFAKKEAASS